MRDDKPRVRIGLPVFNGENYLEEALDSILAQTYSDFELIISDNASTDRTEEIYREYAAKDERIRYFRNETNLGAVRNFNHVFELSSGEYFKWAAHDDMIAPDFLIKCVKVLDQDPTVVLCHSKVKFIDEFGDVLANHRVAHYITELKNVDSFKPQDRFGDLILINHNCLHVLGLIRASVLKRTILLASHMGSDRNLLVELGLLGRFYTIPEHLFFSRDHSERSIRALRLYSRAAWCHPAKEGRLVFPQWSRFFGYFKSVYRMPLSWYERKCCYIHLANWLRLYRKNLLGDLMVAASQIRHRYFTFKTKDQEMLQQKVN
jgi:glycosyltransferase involved in cell wall biosynthesis